MKAVTVRAILFALMLAGAGMLGADLAGQQTLPNLVISRGMPYAYIEFDHVGPRHPLRLGESNVGLWLKVVNNSKMLIEVPTIATGNIDPGFSVLYRILSIGRDDCTAALAGLGYTADFHINAPVQPGDTLLFSVPREQITKSR